MSPIKVAYFGHPGSFSFMAAKKFVKDQARQAYFLPCESAEEVMDYLTIGGCYGVLPVLNSDAGKVAAHAAIVSANRQMVVGEIDIIVHHCLIGLEKTQTGNINKIVSHPQALLQCSKYLKKRFPNAKLVAYSTTSTAAHDLAKGKLNANCAVIASAEAAKIYNLKIIASNIQNTKDNSTHFKVLFNKPAGKPVEDS